MNDVTTKAFEFASDASKQLLTLSTAIITLSITFSHDLLGGVPAHDRTFLKWAWVGYLLSILFGIVTLLALTGSLGRSSDQVVTTIYGANVRVPAALQLVAFLLGTGLIVTFGIRAF